MGFVFEFFDYVYVVMGFELGLVGGFYFVVGGVEFGGECCNDGGFVFECGYEGGLIGGVEMFEVVGVEN